MPSRPSSSSLPRSPNNPPPALSAARLLSLWKSKLLLYAPFALSYGRPGLPVPSDVVSPSPFAGRVFAAELSVLANVRLPRGAPRASAEQVQALLRAWRGKAEAVADARMDGMQPPDFAEYDRVRELVVMENTVIDDWKRRRRTRKGEVIVVDDGLVVNDPDWLDSDEDEVLDGGDATLDEDLYSDCESDTPHPPPTPRPSARPAPAPPVSARLPCPARTTPASGATPRGFLKQPPRRAAAARTAPPPFAQSRARPAGILRASRATAQKRLLETAVLSPLTPAIGKPQLATSPWRRRVGTGKSSRAPAERTPAASPQSGSTRVVTPTRTASSPIRRRVGGTMKTSHTSSGATAAGSPQSGSTCVVTPTRTARSPKRAGVRTMETSRTESGATAAGSTQPVSTPVKAPTLTAPSPKRRRVGGTMQTSRTMSGATAAGSPQPVSTPVKASTLTAPSLKRRGARTMRTSRKRPEPTAPRSPQPAPAPVTTPTTPSQRRGGTGTTQMARTRPAVAALRAPEPIPVAAAHHIPQPASVPAATGKERLSTATASGSGPISTSKMQELRLRAGGSAAPPSQEQAHSLGEARAREALPVPSSSKKHRTRTMRVLPTPHKPVRLALVPARLREEEPIVPARSKPRPRSAPRTSPGDNGSTAINRRAATSVAQGNAIAPAYRHLRARKMRALPLPPKEADAATVTAARRAPASLSSDAGMVTTSPAPKRDGQRPMRTLLYTAEDGTPQAHAPLSVGSSTTTRTEAAAGKASSRKRGNPKPVGVADKPTEEDRPRSGRRNSNPATAHADELTFGVSSPKRARVRATISVPLPLEEEPSDDDAILVPAKAGTAAIRPRHQPQERGYTKKVVERLPSRSRRGNVRGTKRTRAARNSPSTAPTVRRKNVHPRQSARVVDVSLAAVVRRSGEAEAPVAKRPRTTTRQQRRTRAIALSKSAMLPDGDFLKDPFANRGTSDWTTSDWSKRPDSDLSSGYKAARGPLDAFSLMGMIDDAPLAQRTGAAVRKPVVEAAVDSEESEGSVEEVAVTMTDAKELFEEPAASLVELPQRASSVLEPDETSPFDSDLPLTPPRQIGRAAAASCVDDELNELRAYALLDMKDIPMGATAPDDLLEALLISTPPRAPREGERNEEDVIADEDGSVVAIEEKDGKAPPNASQILVAGRQADRVPFTGESLEGQIVLRQGDVAKAVPAHRTPKSSIAPAVNVPGAQLVSDAVAVGYSGDRGDSDGGSMVELDIALNAVPRKLRTEPQDPLTKAGGETFGAVHDEDGRSVARATNGLERLAPDLAIAVPPRTAADRPRLTNSNKADDAARAQQNGNDIRIQHAISNAPLKEAGPASQSGPRAVMAPEKSAAVGDRAAREERASTPGVTASRARGTSAAAAQGLGVQHPAKTGAVAAYDGKGVNASGVLPHGFVVPANADIMTLNEEDRQWLHKRRMMEELFSMAQQLRNMRMDEEANQLTMKAVGLLKEEVHKIQVAVEAAAQTDCAALSSPAPAS